jgi:pyrroloquinoline-quinone synthase
VQFVRDSSLLEAVASSLTELFAPVLMARRLEAWKSHYPWVRVEALEYFQRRIIRAGIESNHAVEFVMQHARTYEMQQRCVDALVKKTDILWRLLDCLSMVSRESGLNVTKAVYDQQYDWRQT